RGGGLLAVRRGLLDAGGPGALAARGLLGPDPGRAVRAARPGDAQPGGHGQPAHRRRAPAAGPRPCPGRGGRPRADQRPRGPRLHPHPGLPPPGPPRLARPHVRAAVAAAELTSDPVALVYTYILACLHWIAVGDWAAADAGLPRVLEAGNRAQLHRMVDQAVLLAAVCRYLTGRFEEAGALSKDARAPAFCLSLPGSFEESAARSEDPRPARRNRHDPMAELWGLVLLAEARLRT